MSGAVCGDIEVLLIQNITAPVLYQRSQLRGLSTHRKRR